MVNYFIYAKDFSGSTEGCRFYHENGLKSLSQFKSDVERMKGEVLAAGDEPEESIIVYLHWGDHCFEVGEHETVRSHKELISGHMGTYAETIVEWIQNSNLCGKNDKIKLLYIVTDGMIDQSSAQRCFELNENMHYETVVFHAFNQHVQEIDLSVAASFFKSRCKVYRNYDLNDDIDISEQFDYDKIDVDNFKDEKENMKSYVKLKFIKQFKHDVLALKEIDKLKKLRTRLFAELASKLEKIKINLNTKDKGEFLRDFVKTHWYKNLNDPSYDAKVDIEKSISTLINYIVSDNKSYSFDALKFEKVFDKPVEEEPIVDVHFKPEQEIEFPDIILDDDKGIPVILLTEFSLLDKIIFHTTKETDMSAEVSPASFNKFKSTMECPLFLLNDADVSESIGYFYTLTVYKELLKNSHRTEPRTRRPFHGGLVLTDTDEFDKYNDYILSATYFNSKKVNYNIGLFYYVLWKNCENKEWMDSNVVEHFKKYVMRRISATVCRIGLSSLPLDPPEYTSLPTALWYCVELSSCIFKDDPQNFNFERLRMYYGVAHAMIEILNHFKYDLDLESIQKRRDLIRHVMILKKIQKYEEKVYYLLEKIFKSVNGFLVSEIEKPFNVKKLNYLKLDHKDMLSDEVVEEEIKLNEYIHLMHFTDDLSKSENGKSLFEMCDKTFRPYFTIDQNKTFYSELAKVTKKVVIKIDGKNKIKLTYEAIDSLDFDQILSTYNLFINCVKDSEQYPTLPEYVDYISKKKKYYGDLVTIFPSNVYKRIEDTYSRYQNIISAVDVKTFIAVCKKYVKRPERIKAEEIMKFDDDKEIDKFLVSEELKVNLKKRKIETDKKASKDKAKKKKANEGDDGTNVDATPAAPGPTQLTRRQLNSLRYRGRNRQRGRGGRFTRRPTRRTR